MPDLDPDEQAVVDTVRDFVDHQVRPVARALEHENTYPEMLIEQMKRIGIFGLAIPEPYGAVNVSTVCYALVTEELARGWMSLAGAMGGHTVVSKLLLEYGTKEQKQHYLPRMATGELRAAMALTEPGGGSDLQAMRTTARPAGDGYLINGAKTWITNARRAGLLALLCKTDPDATPVHRGISILLVEKVPGFTVSKDLPKLGYKGVESCELSFVDCQLLDGVRRRALLPGRTADDRRRGHQRDPAQRHRRAAHRAGRTPLLMTLTDDPYCRGRSGAGARCRGSVGSGTRFVGSETTGSGLGCSDLPAEPEHGGRVELEPDRGRHRAGADSCAERRLHSLDIVGIYLVDRDERAVLAE